MVTLRRFRLDPADGYPPVYGDVRLPAGAAPQSAVVICHGFKGFKDWGFFPPLASAVANRGHAAISFNFSGSGVGEDGRDFSALENFAANTHSRNVLEIRMVLDALAAGSLTGGGNVPARTGLLGHSRGGGEAVIATAADTRVDTLVTWAAIASVERWTDEQIAAWDRGETVFIPNSRTKQEMPMAPGYWRDIIRNRERLNIRRAASRVDVPWLIVHGEQDTSVSVGDAHQLRAAAAAAELQVVEDTGHTFDATHPFGGVSRGLREATQATLDWFDRHLGGRTAAGGAA